MSLFTIVLSSAGTLFRRESAQSFVSWLSHTLLTMSNTGFMAVVVKPLIVKRKVGHVVAKEATRKVVTSQAEPLPNEPA